MGETYLRKHAPKHAEIICYQCTDDVLNALQNNEIDAFARGEPCNGYIAQQQPEFNIIDIQPSLEKVGFAIAKENDMLLNIVNSELKNMSENGTLSKLRKFWKAYNIHLLS
ncbi:type 2 periplasmic-binding domain-containing protein [Spartinivicinus ruber]|uniref:hypothetical protein n=1 Tax=Spartinivicinus ruber TaxID=2683272 RepID=UPI0038B6A52B